jgi:hypothetical protein
VLTNFLILIDFTRDPLLGQFEANNSMIGTIIDITTFIEVGVSLFLGLFWFGLRWPESIKVRKLRRVEGLEEAEAEKAMAGSGWADFKVDYIDSWIQKSVPQSLLAHFTCSLLAFLTSNVFYS